MSERTHAVRLSELPAADARAVLDRFLAGQADRLAAFLAEVQGRGGPADRLDFSLDSLEPLWGWFVAEHRPRRWFAGRHRRPLAPSSDADMRESDPPWWYGFHPEVGQELGPGLARLVTGLADYYFACAHRAHPASRWALGKGRSYAYFQHPVFGLEGRGESDYATPIRFARLALRGVRYTESIALRRALEQWLGMDPAYEAEMERLARPLATHAVRAIEDPRFTHEVSVDDVVAHTQASRVTRLAERLKASSGIEDAVHVDREVILVRAPGLAVADLERVVEDAWKRRRAHDSGRGGVS